MLEYPHSAFISIKSKSKLCVVRMSAHTSFQAYVSSNCRLPALSSAERAVDAHTGASGGTVGQDGSYDLKMSGLRLIRVQV